MAMGVGLELTLGGQIDRNRLERRWQQPVPIDLSPEMVCMLASRLRANGHDGTWHLEKGKTHSWRTSYDKRALGSPCILHRSCDMG
jgi:hypothetical protein